MARFVRIAGTAVARFQRVTFDLGGGGGVQLLHADTVLTASTPTLVAGGYES